MMQDEIHDDTPPKALPSTPDEVAAMLRRAKRNQRRAWAEGYLLAVCAMLRPGDLALGLGRIWGW